MSELTAEEIQELKSAFKMFDKNGDGRVAEHELDSVIRAMGQNPTKAEIRAMIDEMDLNHDGTIDYKEFEKVMRKKGLKKPKELEDELKEAFRVFDRDRNGFITSSELRYTMTNLGERLTDKEVDDMIRDADTNGDGKIDYKEFIKVMTSKY